MTKYKKRKIRVKPIKGHFLTHEQVFGKPKAEEEQGK